MKTVIIFFLSILISHISFAEEKPMRLVDLGWLNGHWKGEFNGNSMELYFSGTEGGVILATYKQLTPEGQIRFMRFSSLIEQSGVIQLHLYPFLNPSPDVFTAKELDGGKVIFERIYGSEECQLTNIMDASNDSLQLQQTCDRFPVRITYEKTSDTEYKEIFFGFLPRDEKQTEVQFERNFQKK